MRVPNVMACTLAQGGRLAATVVPPRARLLQRGGGGAAGAELGTWRAVAGSGSDEKEEEDTDEAGQENGEGGTPASCLLCVACGSGGGGGEGTGGKDKGQRWGDGCHSDARVKEGYGGEQGEAEEGGQGDGFELWDVGSLFGLPGPRPLTVGPG